MSREKFQTLTEQMFYILLALQTECCGVEIMERVRTMTGDRVIVGPGTLYSLLDSFCTEGYIRETACEGRKRSYELAVRGRMKLEAEYRRIRQQAEDYRRFSEGGF